MTDQSNVTEEVRALLLGTVPERPDDVARLRENTQYEKAFDRPALHLEATAFFGSGLVVTTDRTMQQVWLIANLAWRTLQEQSGFIIVPLVSGQPYDVRAYRDRDPAHRPS